MYDPTPAFDQLIIAIKRSKISSGIFSIIEQWSGKFSVLAPGHTLTIKKKGHIYIGK